jgi:hypothetical protein
VGEYFEQHGLARHEASSGQCSSYGYGPFMKVIVAKEEGDVVDSVDEASIGHLLGILLGMAVQVMVQVTGAVAGVVRKFVIRYAICAFQESIPDATRGILPVLARG